MHGRCTNEVLQKDCLGEKNVRRKGGKKNDKRKRAKGGDSEFCQEQENFFKVKAKTSSHLNKGKNEDVNR